jgi:hypothetical protein
LTKETNITERIKFEFRAEFFNLWNWHTFTSGGAWGNGAFDTDMSSATFGKWNGSQSAPRNIQVGAKIIF